MSLSDTEWKVMNVLWDHHPATAREVMDALESFTEADLDAPSLAPSEMAPFFGTRRQVFLTMANHWLVHRGQVADARRAAGRERIGM